MPQNALVFPVNPPKRKILITYKKVDKLAIQGNFNLTKTGHNFIEVSEDTTLEISGVTSLEIDNLGDEEVVINGITLLPQPHFDALKNKFIDDSAGFWDLIDKANVRNSKIFVQPDGTYTDITLNINFLGQEVAFISPPVPPPPFSEVVSTNPLPIVPIVRFMASSIVLTGDLDFIPNKSGTFQVNFNGAIATDQPTGVAGQNVHVTLSTDSFPALWSIILVETGEELFYDGQGNYLRSSNDWVADFNNCFGATTFKILKDIGTQVRVIEYYETSFNYNKVTPANGFPAHPSNLEYTFFKATPAEQLQFLGFDYGYVFINKKADLIMPYILGVDNTLNGVFSIINENLFDHFVALGFGDRNAFGFETEYKIGYTDERSIQGIQFQRLDTMEFSVIYRPCSIK